jgi:hypothetical protein
MASQQIQLVEDILGPFAEVANGAIAGYKNHVYRVINFGVALSELDQTEKEKLIIAACFHDLGIYTEKTFDYLPPSVALAQSHLQSSGRSEWIPEITTMIDQHHRLRALKGSDCRLSEIFRKADLVDFSLGIVKCGLPRSAVASMREQFPNHGFHKNLVRIATGWIVRHPLRPVPVLKW